MKRWGTGNTEQGVVIHPPAQVTALLLRPGGKSFRGGLWPLPLREGLDWGAALATLKQASRTDVTAGHGEGSWLPCLCGPHYLGHTGPPTST